MTGILVVVFSHFELSSESLLVRICVLSIFVIIQKAYDLIFLIFCQNDKYGGYSTIKWHKII